MIKPLSDLVNNDAGTTIDWLIENQHTHVIIEKQKLESIIDLLNDILDSNCRVDEFTDEIDTLLTALTQQ